MEKEYFYDAFISYRHLPDDMKIAERLQRLLERLKKRGAVNGKSRPLRVFRDQSELPVSENLSKDIQREYPGIQGFGVRNIWNMARFYSEYQSNTILHPLVAEISWTKHICMITCKSKNRTLQRNAARKSRYRHQS